jgi:hypothetical protein
LRAIASTAPARSGEVACKFAKANSSIAGRRNTAMPDRTSYYLARESGVRERSGRCFDRLDGGFIFRAFLASPILRDLNTVKQENRTIKVTGNVRLVCV